MKFLPALLLPLMLAPAWAQKSAILATNVTSPGTALAEETKEGVAASLQTQKGAKTLTLTIPAPRGQIVDRAGRPLAQNKRADMPAIKFPRELAAAEEGAIIAFGNKALVAFNKAIGNREADYWLADPQTMVKHCKNRQILPLQFGKPLEAEQLAKLKGLESIGLTTVPIYLRHYPRGKSGGHIIGYVQKLRPLPVDRPVENGDALFWEWKGISGLEKSFDKELAGTPGKVNIIFDEEGREVRQDMLQRPIAGQTVVTTLDANMQKLAEDCIYHRSSMVVMDSNNGEILAMASEPGYDPNLFIPEITPEKWNELQNGDGKPMYARAFQATYPPASTFKVPMCVAYMKSGKIDANTVINAPAFWKPKGYNLKMWNSTRKAEGDMTIQRAIARSNNPWMILAALRVGGDLILSEARNFGFGQATGIPLEEEAGKIPTGHMSQGDIANFAIGQGAVLEATPLQVAQAMTGIATGDAIWRARLVKQVQNEHGSIVTTSKPEAVGHVAASEKTLAPVRRGMIDVVNAKHGTGIQGYNPYAQVAAKTGTAQWRGDMQMVWFAGYVPADAPQYAFAVAFEGGSSGGRTAAPIVKNFFSRLYGQRDFDKDLYAEARLPGDKPRPKKAKVADGDKPEEGQEVAANGDDEDGEKAVKKPAKKRVAKASKRRVAQDTQKRGTQRAVVAAQPVQAPKKRGLLGRLFGR